MSQPTDNEPWTWPLNLAEYDRTPTLTEEEKRILGAFVQYRQTGNKRAPWLAPIQQAMPRLITPLYDAYHLLNLHRSPKLTHLGQSPPSVRFLLHQRPPS